MKNHQLNAAIFAKKIGVQRSSVSHVLSKRNKPSLEFILKINNQFDEIDLNWLLLETKNPPSSFPTSSSKNKNTLTQLDDQLDETIGIQQSSIENKIKLSNAEIVQVIQVYKDGSFSSFFPKT
jgi:plasmid maintenance system antidote protein VapI